jgi:4-aminobutyrate aminotransferase-like enzyme
MIKEVLKVIENEHLVENVRDAGQVLLNGLKQLQVRIQRKNRE